MQIERRNTENQGQYQFQVRYYNSRDNNEPTFVYYKLAYTMQSAWHMMWEHARTEMAQSRLVILDIKYLGCEP